MMNFTKAGRLMFISVIVFEILFSIGAYAFLRWVEDMADYALPIAAISLLLGIGGAFLAGWSTSKADRAAEKQP